MSVRPDLRPCTWHCEKRIVRRRTAGCFDAHDLAEMTFQVLRANREVLQLPLTQCHKQRAIAREHQTRPEMSAAVDRGRLTKYHFDIGQRRFPQLCTGNCSAVAAVAGLGKREIDLARL